jgi:16S rRNA (guanine(966)-N(2))-methyltransferase RsmD
VKRAKKSSSKKSDQPKQVKPVGLRIIGGTFRGRKLAYHGDQTVRPMKDRVREAMFNLLGPGIKQTHAIDLFAGTGSLGLEALSRGTQKCTFLERHHPTANLLKDNIRSLGVEATSEVVVADSFFWWDHDFKFGEMPITLFISPPWPLYSQRPKDFVAMIERTVSEGADGTLIALEADPFFDLKKLPRAESWAIREYLPARLAVFRKEPPKDEETH